MVTAMVMVMVMVMGIKSKNIEEEWDVVITPNKSLWDLDLKEVWRYRDLLGLFVKRDFVAYFKQTVLGPVWYFVQPIFQTLVLIIIGQSAGWIPEGLTGYSFYLAGVIGWNYFADCLRTTSNTFTQNASLFGKVYFPRIITPISIVMSNFLKFAVQFILLLIVYAFEYFTYGNYELSWMIIFVPFLILLIAMMSLGFGMIISSMTTKYRDLAHLIVFVIPLLMWISTVIMPYSSLDPSIRELYMLNPMSSVVETFRYIFIGPAAGSLQIGWLLYSIVLSAVTLIFGSLIFSKVEKNFMDTV